MLLEINILCESVREDEVTYQVTSKIADKVTLDSILKQLGSGLLTLKSYPEVQILVNSFSGDEDSRLDFTRVKGTDTYQRKL
jgi:hypothetical protein